MSELLGPDGKPAKSTVDFNSDTLAVQMVVTKVGDVRIEGPDRVVVPGVGQWVLVSQQLWAGMVNELMVARSQAELQKPESRRARRIQAARDRRN